MSLKEISSVVIRGEKVLTFPLKYDDMGQIIFDAKNNMVAMMRGWGRLQYHPDGEGAAAKLQDDIGRAFVDAMNDAAKREGIL